MYFSLGKNEENLNTIQSPLLVFYSPSDTTSQKKWQSLDSPYSTIPHKSPKHK